MLQCTSNAARVTPTAAQLPPGCQCSKSVAVSDHSTATDGLVVQVASVQNLLLCLTTALLLMVEWSRLPVFKICCCVWPQHCYWWSSGPGCQCSKSVAVSDHSTATDGLVVQVASVQNLLLCLTTALLLMVEWSRLPVFKICCCVWPQHCYWWSSGPGCQCSKSVAVSDHSTATDRSMV